MPKRPDIAEKDGICLELEYGYQMDNHSLGKIPNYAQCGYEMDAMLISQDVKGATDNAYVEALIRDMEPSLSPDGWGAHSDWKSLQRVGSVVDAHAAYITHKTGKAAVLRYQCGKWNEIIGVLKAGRAVGFCSQITESGHFVVIVGAMWNARGITDLIFHDPYGNAFKGYTDKDGAYVRYPMDWIKNGRCWGDRKGESLTFVYTR